MPRESLVVDGTAKTCRGVIAGLERGVAGLAPGDVVLAIVDDIPTRVDVYAWAQRKGHRVLEEQRRESGFLFYIAKGGPNTAARAEEIRGDPVQAQEERAETTGYPGGGP